MPDNQTIVLEHAPYVKGFLESQTVEEIQKSVVEYSIGQQYALNTKLFNRKQKKVLEKAFNDNDFKTRTNGKYNKGDTFFLKERLRKKIEARKEHFEQLQQKEQVY